MRDRILPGRLCFLSLNALSYLEHDVTDFVGGAEAQEVRIARALAQRGWQVTFLTEDHGQGDQVLEDGIRVRATFAPRAGIPILRFVSPRLRSVWRALAATPADVYLTRTASIWSLVIAAHARARGGASVLALSHDREARLELRGMLNFRDRWLFRRGLRRVDQVIAQTDEQARLLREKTGREALVVPNGIDPIPGPRRALGRRGRGRARGLWVGTLRPWKRPELFAELVANTPEVDFWMVGGPDPHHPAVSRRLMARAKKLPNLRMLGQVPPRRMGKCFDDVDFLVSTSAAEGFANTFLEAWAHGLPVVSMGPDPQAAISNAGAGLLVADLPGLRRTVQALAADDALCVELGQRGRQLVEREFSTQVLVDRYDRICRRLAGSPDVAPLVGAAS